MILLMFKKLNFDNLQLITIKPSKTEDLNQQSKPKNK